MLVREFREARICSALEISSPNLSPAVRYSWEMVVIKMSFPLKEYLSLGQVKGCRQQSLVGESVF